MTSHENKEFIDFSLPMITEEGIVTMNLADKVNKSNVILAFFPAAWAPFCITEMESLRKEYQTYKDANTEIIGISGDLPWALNKFKTDQKIPFPLLSDNTFKASKAYGIHLNNPMQNGMDFSNRGIFLIKNGKISYEWRASDPTKQPDLEAIRSAL